MRAIHSLKTVVDGNKITITGELMDVTMPAMIGQRTTIMHPVMGDMNKPRHIQVTTHGVMVLRHGTDGVLFPKDELVSVMLEVDGKLTDPPQFVEQPTADNLTGKVVSEIESTVQVQHSDDGKNWNDLKQDPKDYPVLVGKHYRCIARHKHGETASNSFKVK